MRPIVSFIGWHNAGKTTIIRGVAQNLRERGYKIAVIKATKHTDISLQRPGSDTSLYRQDGMEGVALVGPEEIALFQDNTGEPLKHLAFRMFPQADLVIGEGFKDAAEIPKIEVAGGATAEPPLRNTVSGVIAVVADSPRQGPVMFRPDQIQEISDFLERRFLNRRNRGEVSLFVDGVEIPLKRFVRRALTGIVHGFVQSLKFTDGAREVEIRLYTERYVDPPDSSVSTERRS